MVGILRSSIKNPGEVTKETVDSNDYLHYVIKESLRYDNPAPSTLEYTAKKDIQICNVPIMKNHKIFISIHGLHNDTNQYIEPEKFIPERFDPESSYFKTPNSSGSSKARSPHSFMSFGTGLRNCPGKSLGKIYPC